jgi:hypothetical protein
VAICERGMLPDALASRFELTFFGGPWCGTFRFETLRIVGIAVCGILCLCGAFGDVKGFDTERTEELRKKIGEGERDPSAGLKQRSRPQDDDAGRIVRKPKSTGRIACATMQSARRKAGERWIYLKK